MQEGAGNTGVWTLAGTYSRGGLTISCAGVCQTHGSLDFGRRVEQSAADTEEEEEEEKEKKDTRQRLYNPNTEGGEQMKYEKV